MRCLIPHLRQENWLPKCSTCPYFLAFVKETEPKRLQKAESKTCMCSFTDKQPQLKCRQSGHPCPCHLVQMYHFAKVWVPCTWFPVSSEWHSLWKNCCICALKWTFYLRCSMHAFYLRTWAPVLRYLFILGGIVWMNTHAQGRDTKLAKALLLRKPQLSGAERHTHTQDPWFIYSISDY